VAERRKIRIQEGNNEEMKEERRLEKTERRKYVRREKTKGSVNKQGKASR
jgi:hypothetical protein